jgi:hypothetical protein
MRNCLSFTRIRSFVLTLLLVATDAIVFHMKCATSSTIRLYSTKNCTSTDVLATNKSLPDYSKTTVEVDTIHLEKKSRADAWRRKLVWL